MMKRRRRRNSLLFLVALGFVGTTTFAATPDAEIHLTTITNHNDHQATTTRSILGVYGYFGSRNTIKNANLILHDDEENPLLCNPNVTATNTQPTDSPFILVVPRGECSFEYKAWQAQHLMGASALFIYNNLQSRYGWNETSQKVLFPVELHDYDCRWDYGGQSNYTDVGNLDPPRYQTDVHDAGVVFSSPNNTCFLSNPSQCDSKKCILTGRNDRSPTHFFGCCAWDIPISMNGDDDLELTEEVTIPSIFLTMAQGDEVLELLLGGNNNQDVVLVSYVGERPYPKYNPSSFLLVVLATWLTWFASWYSAKRYRLAKYKLTHPVESETNTAQQQTQQTPPAAVISVARGAERVHRSSEGVVATPNTTTATTGSFPEDSTHQATDDDDDDDEEYADGDVELSEQQRTTNNNNNRQEEAAPSEAPPSSTTTTRHPLAAAANNIWDDRVVSNDAVREIPEGQQTQGLQSTNMGPAHSEDDAQNPTRQQQQQQYYYPDEPLHSFQLTLWHAVLFVIVASILLLLLFYFEFYTTVSVLYAVGCSASVGQILIRPTLNLLQNRIFKKYFGFGCTTRALCPKLHFCFGLFSRITLLDIMTSLLGYTWGACWLYVYFTSNDPSSNTFYWITQDVFGCCLCILFLSVLQLNSLQVATALLTAVFVYDIFFVFISPYLFHGDSVMVTVATGGGPSNQVTEEYCFKYPNDKECRMGQPLPMLLTIPKMFDFRGGSNLLGLGDIVLPGLLTSFAARLDEAQRLVGGHTTLPVVVPPVGTGGYLFPLIVAYFFGLLFATLAVVWMERGQPALLYIVPLCLGTMIARAKRQGQWKELWSGSTASTNGYATRLHQPQVLIWADRLVQYCHTHTFYVTPQELGTMAESELDDEEDYDDLSLVERVEGNNGNGGNRMAGR